MVCFTWQMLVLLKFSKKLHNANSMMLLDAIYLLVFISMFSFKDDRFLIDAIFILQKHPLCSMFYCNLNKKAFQIPPPMLVLYSRLQVGITAKLDEIQKQYRVLSYRHTKNGDSQSMVNLNEAHQILIDPYKRSFYDRFGDECLYLLTNTEWSYFISRFFTEFNIFCLNSYFFLTVFNYFFLGFIYKIPIESTAFKFSPIIFSPVFLLVASLNAARTIRKTDPSFKKVSHALIFASLMYNPVGIIAGGLSIWILIAHQAVAVLFSQIFFLKLFGIRSLRLLAFLAVKTGLLCCYYLETTMLKYFIPCLIALGLCCLDFLLGALLSLLLIPMCLSIYLSVVCRYTVIPNIMHSIHGLIGFLILYGYYKFFTKLSAKYKTFGIHLALNGSSLEEEQV